MLLSAQAFAFPCSVCRCGDPSFFLNNAQQLAAGRFLFAIEHFNTRKSSAAEEQQIGLEKVFSPLRVAHGDLESQVQNALQLTFKYGLGSRIMLMASAPYTFNRISSASGVETTDGFGDPEIMAIAQLLNFANNTWALQGIAGTRVPLGKSDQTDESGARLEQHLQTGTGAWAGMFGAQLLYGGGSIPLFFSASYQTNGTNDHDFSYGNVFRFNAATQRGLSKSLDAIAEINGRTADYDTEGTATDPNSGGTIVYFSPGLRLRLGSALSLRSQVQIPVIKSLHGEQNEKVNVRTGLVWSL
jgi:hypothetical protein